MKKGIIITILVIVVVLVAGSFIVSRFLPGKIELTSPYEEGHDVTD